jgi:pimeloyl-ACP methyl ester carboxylesterase
VSQPRSAPFTFASGGDRLVGALYLPAEQPLAAAVTTGPLTSIKEQATGAYARALAERGFAALAFDDRTFGESDGEPRQFEQPTGKADDVRAAVTALGADERTRDLPVVGVGVCAGAGYMARAVADDRRLCAFAGVAGYYADAHRARRIIPRRLPGGELRASSAQEAAIQGGLSGTSTPGHGARVVPRPTIGPARPQVQARGIGERGHRLICCRVQVLPSGSMVPA